MEGGVEIFELSTEEGEEQETTYSCKIKLLGLIFIMHRTSFMSIRKNKKNNKERKKINKRKNQLIQ